MSGPEPAGGDAVKACCAAVYGSEWARLLIGDAMHPGGSQLTRRLGERLELGPEARLLDVASGRGASTLYLAGRFGCQVVGVDLSPANVEAARQQAERVGLDRLVSFEVADAEALPVADQEFTALICECAFCIFPDKRRAASEFARVLRPGGRLGLSDLVRRAQLPPELCTLAGWVACLADARPEREYLAYLEGAGFRGPVVEIHDQALAELVRRIRLRLLTAALLDRLGRLELEGVDLESASRLGREAELAIRDGRLGYVLLTAERE